LRRIHGEAIVSDVVLSMGPLPNVDVTSAGLDLDFPTRKMSRKVGVGDFFAFVEAAKSSGEGFIWAGGKK